MQAEDRELPAPCNDNPCSMLDENMLIPTPCNDNPSSENQKSCHAKTMQRMGFDTPSPPQKRLKTCWDMLVEAFPCPPEYQHRVWAERIRRQFRDNCGLPYYWLTCECMKCERIQNEELKNYQTILFECTDSLNVRAGEVNESSNRQPLSQVEIRKACFGAESDELDTYRMEGPARAQTPPLPNFGYVHLFLEQAHVGTADPHTPFMTHLSGMDAFPIEREHPRVMWVRAKSVTPTYLSFR